MKKLLFIFLFLIFFTSPTFAQNFEKVTYTKYGNTIYCSDGTKYYRTNSSIISSDNKMYHTSRDFVNCGNGIIYIQYGLNIKGNNGVTYSKYGYKYTCNSGTEWEFIGNRLSNTNQINKNDKISDILFFIFYNND